MTARRPGLTRRRLALAAACGCGTALARAPARAASCPDAPLASLALRDTYGTITIAVHLGDRPVSMVLDTGSDAGLLDPDAATLAGAILGGAKIPVDGAAPGATLPLASIPRLSLGELALRDVVFPVGRLPTAPRIDPPIVGLIGGDLLTRFTLDIDLPARLLHLSAAGDPLDDCVWSRPVPAGARPVAATRTGNRFFIPAALDGHPTLALLDTGAASRVVSTAFAASIGTDARAMAADPGGYERGIAAAESIYRWHRFRTLAIAGETTRDPVLTVAPLSPSETILLGADWFATHRVRIDPATAAVAITATPPLRTGRSATTGR